VRKGTAIAPHLHGGYQEFRLRAGTENVAGIVGVGKAVQLATLEMDAQTAYITALRDKAENVRQTEMAKMGRNLAALSETELALVDALTKAIANNVVVKLKELGEQVYGREGEDSGEWILVDLGEVLVHIMQPAVREYYNLEELWSKAQSLRPKLAKAPE